MTSPSQYRHSPLRRLLRDSMKRLYFAFYKLGVRVGVHILPAHYYGIVPNIIELERTVDLWAKPSAMFGVGIDLDEQIDNLRRVCVPFQQEFRGNPYYISTLSISRSDQGARGFSATSKRRCCTRPSATTSPHN
jgi:hypothetical protein